MKRNLAKRVTNKFYFHDVLLIVRFARFLFWSTRYRNDNTKSSIVSTIKALISDFSHVLLFPEDFSYRGSLNGLYADKKDQSDFSFFDLYHFNQELLDFYIKVKSDHQISLHIYTTGTVQDSSELQPIISPVFDSIHSVVDMRIEKTDPEAYRWLAEKIGVKPEEIIFIDDSQRNIDASLEAGVHGILYESNEQIVGDVGQLVMGSRQ